MKDASATAEAQKAELTKAHDELMTRVTSLEESISSKDKEAAALKGSLDKMQVGFSLSFRYVWLWKMIACDVMSLPALSIRSPPCRGRTVRARSLRRKAFGLHESCSCFQVFLGAACRFT